MNTHDGHKLLFIDICMGGFRVIAPGILESANAGICDANHPEIKPIVESAFATGKKIRKVLADDYKQLFGEDIENLPKEEEY